MKELKNNYMKKIYTFNSWKDKFKNKILEINNFKINNHKYNNKNNNKCRVSITIQKSIN